ncbi:hypothetical protein ASF61_15330 [Duganella sp. Leaf126]|uniref:GIN domain-containing protein n=1 Tax=Duganella sp. Leaf126 TaxID=1736266 RepID=UPI0006F48191|nr:DUF2807 domain-containing protein [Duganella sp. Leaf126]KQQ32407.1 hypothetical protein ASF61_15330 [Duganella sp. Leaf126]
MRSLLKIGFSLLLLSFVLIGITYSMLKSYGAANPSSNAGRSLASETRRVDATTSVVDVSGPIDLVLTQGPTASLKVRGEQRSLGNIATDQHGRDLQIRTTGMLLNPRHRLQVELVLPQLQALVVRSSGSVKVSGFTGELMEMQLQGSGDVAFNGRYSKLGAALHGSGNLALNAGSSQHVELELLGSGRITAAGSCQVMDMHLLGSGTVDARHLAADRVQVMLKGSGTGHVFARQAAEVALQGSGNLTVYGKPVQRDVSHKGSGSVDWQ